jgi:hypothetical protein
MEVESHFEKKCYFCSHRKATAGSSLCGVQNAFFEKCLERTAGLASKKNNLNFYVKQN